jgi:hypothetical protein
MLNRNIEVGSGSSGKETRWAEVEEIAEAVFTGEDENLD